MADLKISELTNLTAADPANDMIPIVDVSATPPASGSTKRISINNLLACSPSATLASATITGDLTVDTSTLKVDSTNNRVGIGTASPNNTLTVRGTQDTGIELNSADSNSSRLITAYDPANTRWYINSTLSGSGTTIPLAFLIQNSEVARFNTTGNLAFANGKGIDFSAVTGGTGTATGNVLNDYEEGTWTIGLTFGGGNTGLTTVLNTGRYTKIGRQVTVSGRLELSNKGSSTGAAVITGLPFSIANTNDAQQAASFRCNGVSYTGAFQGYGTAGSTTIPLEQISEAGSNTNLTDSNFVNGTSIHISLTYTV